MVFTAQMIIDSLWRCFNTLGCAPDFSGESLASKPKGASRADELSPPKLRTTDLSTQLSSNVEDNQVFASKTTSRNNTPLPSSRYDPRFLSKPAEQQEEIQKVDVDGDDNCLNPPLVDATDRRSAEVLARARIQAMKEASFRAHRIVGKESHNSPFLGPPPSSSAKSYSERSHKRKLEIFRPRQRPDHEYTESSRPYSCGASADDAFHLAASIFRVNNDSFLENNPLRILCFANPVRDDSEDLSGDKQDVTDASKPTSSKDDGNYQDDSESVNSTLSDMEHLKKAQPPVPLFDHFLVLISEDHKDEISKIVRNGTHKTFEWIHFDDSSEFMTTGSEDRTHSENTSTIRLASHRCDAPLFENDHLPFLKPVFEESDKNVSSGVPSPLNSSMITLFKPQLQRVESGNFINPPRIPVYSQRTLHSTHQKQDALEDRSNKVLSVDSSTLIRNDSMSLF